ncbi:hypothetical protein JKP88DRAFT_240957 [Tribonema minus]|uniref:Uncharacterized protein n=1 Tax=Tribonema minus TaxID=303371 RepID=A0A836CK31_9STRA|nr:hypothetical protein JKP88DRAFT_240957 [Tribonema minus]
MPDWTRILVIILVLALGVIGAGVALTAVQTKSPHGSTAPTDAPESIATRAPGADTASSDMVAVAGNIIQKRKVALIPIMRGYQNVHDALKQMCLLEAHLFDSERACHDCLLKHLLTIQGLLEEAHSLVENGDKSLPVETDLQGLEQAVRGLHIEYFDSDRSPATRHTIACKIRRLRKPLMQVYGRPMVA